ncbi:coproporphyrinogen III oxidase [Oceaniferula spumae]|uniref:coproporphyrinogen oxidase n=1 Tax=Oceaniferula spumae TaxID=2979115 RepID=A0AAT9FGG9_9BACT
MSSPTPSESALELVSSLQKQFVQGLEKVAVSVKFNHAEWLRDEGRHGGGSRYFTSDNEVFNRASVNVSHIHYQDDPDKKLASATALSTIIHPRNAHAPSMHMHISWTEMKGGQGGYWRVMADLNPSIEYAEDSEIFRQCFETVAPEQFEEGSAQGDKYFHIPALGRHRGVVHFYLEQYRSDDPAADLALASRFGSAVIDCYLDLLGKRMQSEQSSEDRNVQLAYHTLYLFQVLTLDRGTTSGLLVHDQNDLGIMGSLPSHIDRELLESWKEKMTSPQDELLRSLVNAIPANGEISDSVRLQLAHAVRTHYREHPEALRQQASGNVVPPTVDNHR